MDVYSLSNQTSFCPALEGPKWEDLILPAIPVAGLLLSKIGDLFRWLFVEADKVPEEPALPSPPPRLPTLTELNSIDNDGALKRYLELVKNASYARKAQLFCPLYLRPFDIVVIPNGEYVHRTPVPEDVINAGGDPKNYWKGPLFTEYLPKIKNGSLFRLQCSLFHDPTTYTDKPMKTHDMRHLFNDVNTEHPGIHVAEMDDNERLKMLLEQLYNLYPKADNDLSGIGIGVFVRDRQKNTVRSFIRDMPADTQKKLSLIVSVISSLALSHFSKEDVDNPLLNGMEICTTFYTKRGTMTTFFHKDTRRSDASAIDFNDPVNKNRFPIQNNFLTGDSSYRVNLVILIQDLHDKNKESRGFVLPTVAIGVTPGPCNR